MAFEICRLQNCIPLRKRDRERSLCTTTQSSQHQQNLKTSELSMIWQALVDIDNFESKKSYLSLVQATVQLTHESSS